MARGFTLLEMLVVLVILGMAAAVVAPPLARTMERVSEAGHRDDVRRGLESLPGLARAGGRALVFPAGEPMGVPERAWPDGWSVVPVTGLHVEPTGFCRAGAVTVVAPSGPLAWTLETPDCRVVVDAP